MRSLHTTVAEMQNELYKMQRDLAVGDDNKSKNKKYEEDEEAARPGNPLSKVSRLLSRLAWTVSCHVPP